MLYFLMFLQIGVMFYSLRLHRRGQLFANVIPAGIAVQIFGIGTAFVAILKICFILFVGGTADESRKEVANAEYAALFYFGEYLAENYPDKNLTILVAPEGKADLNQHNRLQGLQDGSEGKLITNVVEVEFAESQGRRKRRSYTYEKLNETLIAQNDQEVVVSLIGLPLDYHLMPFWNSKSLPQFYSYRGFSWEIDLDIKANIIAGFITFNPKNKFKGKDGAKAEATEEFFNKHFIFVTKDNVDQMKSEFPSLFEVPGLKE